MQDDVEHLLFLFLCRKYIQKADDRQHRMSLQYTEAAHDLAKEITTFLQTLEGNSALARVRQLEAALRDIVSNPHSHYRLVEKARAVLGDATETKEG